jgi:hypothetical protein
MILIILIHNVWQLLKFVLVHQSQNFQKLCMNINNAYAVRIINKVKKVLCDLYGEIKHI